LGSVFFSRATFKWAFQGFLLPLLSLSPLFFSPGSSQSPSSGKRAAIDGFVWLQSGLPFPVPETFVKNPSNRSHSPLSQHPASSARSWVWHQFRSLFFFFLMVKSPLHKKNLSRRPNAIWGPKLAPPPLSMELQGLIQRNFPSFPTGSRDHIGNKFLTGIGEMKKFGIESIVAPHEADAERRFPVASRLR
jgi:hypothetical protein